MSHPHACAQQRRPAGPRWGAHCTTRDSLLLKAPKCQTRKGNSRKAGLPSTTRARRLQVEHSRHTLHRRGVLSLAAGTREPDASSCGTHGVGISAEHCRSCTPMHEPGRTACTGIGCSAAERGQPGNAPPAVPLRSCFPHHALPHVPSPHPDAPARGRIACVLWTSMAPASACIMAPVAAALASCGCARARPRAGAPLPAPWPSSVKDIVCG